MAKYDPRLDRLAAHFMRDEESPHGWYFRAQEATSFGSGHLRVEWHTDDMTASPTELDIKRTVRGSRIVCQDVDGAKWVDFLSEPFDSIITRLEQRARRAEVPASLEEFTAFLGLHAPKEELCKISTM